MKFGNLYKTMKKIIIVDNLTPYSLFFLLLYRLFGFKVVYLNAVFLKNREFLVAILESCGIVSVDYSKFENYDFEASFNMPYEFASKIHNKLIKEDEYRLLNSFFCVNNKQKAYVAFIDIIRKYIGNLCDVFIVSDCYAENYKVYLWHKRNFVINKIDSDYVNLNNIIISYIGFMFFVFYKLYQFSFSKVKNILNKKNISNDVEIQNKDTTSSDIIYFPHKGLKTANSYEKNFFYADNLNSPFNKYNIEHIEYDTVSNKEYDSIKDDYEEKKLKYRFISKIDTKSILLLVVKFFKTVKFFPLSSSKILLLSLYINLAYYIYHLEKNKNAKIALVGYDYLFPKTLALALDVLKVHTVAYQERYLSAFVGLGSVSVDTYFMWNELLKERMEKSGLSFIGEVIVVGCVKINLFNMKSDKKLLEMKTNYDKVIVAFDYHSADNKFDDKRLPVANWKNNLIFYRDMIKLAINFPNVYIIIRGKDDRWCNMEVFEDIYSIIKSMDNIDVSRNFEDLNVSYQLVRDADLVIGRYTSLMEESVAYGVPAISCDYGCNFSENIERMYDGDSCFRFVVSYDELKTQVRDIFVKDIVDFKCVNKLYKTVENPREIILNKIEELLLECK